ncbi:MULTISPECIES: hypothetical protein [Acidiplasma]|uniref:Uncharacterized protein n=1 Tax=Acidiplasma aeolicum TaxID=507754 RepID=A0A0Q0VWC8_9ARCH|nr:MULTISPECIES: hypothetical protein [Acidiplasma]KJE48693.1 hypothetical protein TZ01_08680 [Acidiplasma sp. MBA-1]KPV47550.1 hypothetical protein SE19_00565 [Acidiplasma aeolicum]KQB35946.1 hypothetical protein AOG54_08330 [Acidiplasma aeolicum]WMT55466.1 MAG: hypothetical protein RE470_02200 [Acidiplasma sp.]
MAEKKELENKEEDAEDETVIRKTISIKGVSSDLYKRIQKLSSDTGKTIGQITDEAYRSFVGSIDNAKHLSDNFIKGLKEGSSEYIENIKDLDISGKDLEEIGRKIVFKNIENLTFTDITGEQFDKYVISIINVKNVIIPKTLSKAKVILRCNFVDKITS